MKRITIIALTLAVGAGARAFGMYHTFQARVHDVAQQCVEAGRQQQQIGFPVSDAGLFLLIN